MIAYALLLIVMVVGIALVGVANRWFHGEFRVGSGWYLVLGLTLLIPFIDSPFLLARSLAQPNPNIQEFLWLRTAFFCMGTFLIVRYVWLAFTNRTRHEAME